ncbi:MAG: hypothetical protein Q7J07_01165 [Pelolinea sp.]|nr:hypothetical protein [Pelolinea sp.]
MYSVLFVCTANRFRSPIAEIIFRELLIKQKIEKQWEVGSAGTWAQPGFPVIPSIEWMRENLGLDVSGHQSKPISKEMVTNYDLVLVMEANQKEALSVEFPEENRKVFILTELTDGPVYDIPDPVTQTDEDYLSVAKEIVKLVEINFQEICKRAEKI